MSRSKACNLAVPCGDCDYCSDKRRAAVVRSIKKIFPLGGAHGVMTAHISSYITPAAKFNLFGKANQPANLGRLFEKAKIDGPVLVGFHLKYGNTANDPVYMMDWTAIFEAPSSSVPETYARLETARRRHSPRIVGLGLGETKTRKQIDDTLDRIVGCTAAATADLIAAHSARERAAFVCRLTAIRSTDRLWAKGLARKPAGSWYRLEPGDASVPVPNSNGVFDSGGRD